MFITIVVEADVKFFEPIVYLINFVLIIVFIDFNSYISQFFF